MDLEKITRSVCTLVTSTGKYIRNEAALLKKEEIETKSANNFVTAVDKASEERLIGGLSEILPGTGFIAEESPLLGRKSLNWIIDPLDGTTNFIHRVPMFSVSVALASEKEVILGVVYEVNLDECFSTWKGGPSYMNGREIRVSGIRMVSDSLFATGFPYYDYGRLDQYIGVFKYMMQNSHGVRRLGSAAADLAYVACGRYDGFYEYGLSPWDVAAGALLVKNAGGIVSDFSGEDDYLFGREIIATNSRVFNEFLGVMKQYF